MTYQEFKNKYNGRYIDYDGAYGYQCWDLAQYYFTEVLNVPDYVLSGCGLVSNMLYQPKRADLDAYFDEIDVHTMGAGDVCIMEYGHICIFDNWDGNCNWFFSQNPNPCQVMKVNESGMHAFRRKKETPPAPEPTPVITPNVERDEYKNQIEVIVTELRIRTSPSLNGTVIGYANIGYYNYLETTEADGYTWYRISDNNWIAYNEEWEHVYPAKPTQEFIELEILDKKDDYVLVDLGKVWLHK